MATAYTDTSGWQGGLLGTGLGALLNWASGGALGLGGVLGLGNLGRSIQGSQAADAANANQYNFGAAMLGLPNAAGETTGPVKGKPGQPSTYPQQSLGSQLSDILGQQTAYGNKVLGDLNVSGLKMYTDLFNRTGDRNAALQDTYSGLSRAAATGGAQLGNQLRGGYDALGRGFGQRESDVMGLLSGMGATERADLTEYLNNQAAANQANLSARGLGSSTLTANQANADARTRSRELGALEERLRTQQAGTLAGLRGDTLLAQERGMGAQTALGSTNLDRMANLGLAGAGAQERGQNMLGSVQEAGIQNYLGGLGRQYGFGLDQYGRQMDLASQTAAQQLGWLQSLNSQGPSVDAAFGSLLNYLGARNAPQPQQPNFFESLAPGIGGGIGTGLGAATAGGIGSLFGGAGGIAGKVALMMCIDAYANIETPEGPKHLTSIEPGDYVKSGDGEFIRVVGKDCGMPHVTRFDDYVIIEKEGQSLVCTKDHIIDGRPAGGWPSARPHQLVVSGDLKLEGADTYVANGFVVTSMFTVTE